jgi:hypothetical protein
MSDFSTPGTFNTYSYGQVVYHTNYGDQEQGEGTGGQTQTFIIADATSSDDVKKKLIPINFVSCPDTVSGIPGNNFLVNYGLQKVHDVIPVSSTSQSTSLQTNTIVTKPGTINFVTAAPQQIISPGTSELITIPSPTTLQNKKKVRPRSGDANYKIKIEVINRQKKGRKQKVPGQTREERKYKANTNKPYINSKGEFWVLFI